MTEHGTINNETSTAARQQQGEPRTMTNPIFKDELLELAYKYMDSQGNSIFGQLAAGYIRLTVEVARLRLERTSLGRVPAPIAEPDSSKTPREAKT